MPLKPEAIDRIQKKYSYLINYVSNDPTEPIDPITYRDSSGDSLLHIAAHRGDENTVVELLEAGMNINILGDMGSTPLHYAARGPHKGTIALLLKCGARTDIKDEFGEVPAIVL
jgi:ankyrin repeat protein